MAEIRIYGAGDDHTLELRGLLVDAGYRVEFRDIRGQYGAENRGYLLARGLNHIPQVFRKDGTHLGDYEQALEELAAIDPDADFEADAALQTAADRAAWDYPAHGPAGQVG